MPGNPQREGILPPSGPWTLDPLDLKHSHEDNVYIPMSSAVRVEIVRFCRDHIPDGN